MNTHKIFNIMIALIFGISLFGVPNSSVFAQTSSIITVTNDHDNGPGSLRQAIDDASSGDSIVFDAGYTIRLASHLTVDKDLTIFGSSEIGGVPLNVTLSGDADGNGTGDVGVMLVNPGLNVNLVILTIANGSSNYGGGIMNYGNLVLDNIGFSNNLAVDSGAAVYNEGNIGIWNNGFGNNSAQNDGGGIYNKGSITIWDSTFANNSSLIEGGAIANFGTLEIMRSTFYGNSAESGAAIRNDGVLTITNSTIASNTATLRGGALYDSGLTTIINNTFSGNSALGGSGIYTEYPFTTLINTIVADNTLGSNCSGSIIDGGNNLVWPDTTCPGINADPQLGALSWYGGPTLTVPLGISSAAVDKGNDTVCAELPGAGSLDQRGVSRPQGPHCDIGSFEREKPLNQTPLIVSITAPFVPVSLGQSITPSVDFSDLDIGDTHTVTWDWGDGLITIASATVPSVTTSHTYSTAGVYTITATITDAAGESDTEFFQYVVAYDPSGGFVTGGGWIWSPLRAYVPDVTLEGKATFGFVSKYQKGAKVPTGNTEFQFKIADLNFKSTSYDWLVVTGSDYAMFKGVGTINNEGVYKFMIWAGDNDPDTFRIKIWYEEGDNEIVVYDNGTDQEIGGGSIVVHTAK